MIDPIVLKGFRDSLPGEEIPKKNIERKLESVFESFGFVPIDTHVLEYESVLLGKGGGETDKQIFHFEDNGGRKVAMRFDLTVPFARFLALHHAELPLPFKRYHINKVWRGENPQKGRYREFIQCDFDIVGVDNAESDFEILSLMYASFHALGIENVCFHVANRALFNEFLETIGISEKSIDILRTVDKLRKIGKDEVRNLLVEITGDEKKSDMIISYITSGDGKDFEATLDAIVSLIGKETESSERMRRIFSYLKENGIEKFYVYDPSITRGLDYYTGIVYETFLTDYEAIGSVCSGGRYNNLASLYTKEVLPGVGASIGLDRLLAALTELKSPLAKDTKSADLVILYKPEEAEKAISTAFSLRMEGIKTDIYLLPQKKAKAQYEYAEKLSIPFALSFKDGLYELKNLKTRETSEVDSLLRVAELCR